MGLNGLTLAGKVKSIEGLDFAKESYYVHVIDGGKSTATAKVSEDGTYTLELNTDEICGNVEIKVVPEALCESAKNIPTISKTLSVEFLKKNLVEKLKLNLRLPPDIINWFQFISKTYNMHGTVYSTRFDLAGGNPVPVAVEPLPMVKIEFYEVDNLLLPLKAVREDYIGEAYSDPDGNYTFSFNFKYRRYPYLYILPLTQDKVPDIRARLYQFVNGSWMLVHEDKVDWNINVNYTRSYFIPEEEVILKPGNCTNPVKDFSFVSLGLLPIDDARFIKGYVTSKPEDPVSVSHQPLCGVLRIFGLFGSDTGVVKYSAEFARADENGRPLEVDVSTGAPLGWTQIYDSLYNSRWDDAKKIWGVRILGPEAGTGLYSNIDMEPESLWHEHALKITWNSANHPNGYYLLRVTGYNKDGKSTGTYQMPVIRIDNSLPQVSLTALSSTLGGISECGYVRLSPADRRLSFELTAYDSEGHVLQYQISGIRGKDALQAVKPLLVQRPDKNSCWNGVISEEVNLLIDPLPAAISHCPAVAYSFRLEVWGSATNCYSQVVSTQYAVKSTNLVIAEA